MIWSIYDTISMICIQMIWLLWHNLYLYSTCGPPGREGSHLLERRNWIFNKIIERKWKWKKNVNDYKTKMYTKRWLLWHDTRCSKVFAQKYKIIIDEILRSPLNSGDLKLCIWWLKCTAQSHSTHIHTALIPNKWFHYLLIKMACAVVANLCIWWLYCTLASSDKFPEASSLARTLIR